MSQAPGAADTVAAVAVTVFGAVILWQASVIPESPLYAAVGPKLVPYIAGCGLVGLGLLLMAHAWRGGWSSGLEEVRNAPPINPRSFGLLLAGLAANLLLIDTLGFVFAGTVQFVLVAWALNTRSILRAALIGLAVTFGAYLFFAKALGVSIGAGVLEGLL